MIFLHKKLLDLSFSLSLLFIAFGAVTSSHAYAFSKSIINLNEQSLDDGENIDIEVLPVYSRNITSVDDVFTSDNVLVFIQDTIGLKRTVGDVLTQSIGVELNGQGGLLQSYNMRGFSRDRIKTEVNGIPIVTDRRAGNSVSFLPTELINSVYIQKGPSSSLYGSGAMGGVISLSTVSDEKLIGIKLQPDSGFNGLNNQSIYGQYSNNLFNVGVVHRKAKNNYSADNTLLNSKFEQSTVTANAELLWHNININASLIYSHGVNIGKSSSTFPNSRISDYPTDDHLLSQVQFSNIDKTWKLQLFQHKQNWQTNILHLNNGVISRQNITDYSSQALGALATYALNQTLFGVELNTRKNINIVEQEFTAQNSLVFKNPSVNAQENNIGIYINQQWFVNAFTVNAGIRYDTASVNPEEYLDINRPLTINTIEQSDAVSNHSFSGSINTKYKVNNQTSISVELASSFRFPTVSELLFSGETPRGLTQGNPNLLPENSVGYQLSLTHKFSPTIESKISTYLYNIENYIERTTDTINKGTEDELAITGYINTDQVTIKGAELLVTWQASNTFDSSLGMQWQQGKNQNNSTVDDGLPMAIKWAFTWSPLIKKVNGFAMTSQVNYRFKRNSNGPSEIKLTKALIWNSTMSFALNNHTKVAISLLNVMNENYKSSSDEDAPFQPKRALDLTFTWFY